MALGALLKCNIKSSPKIFEMAKTAIDSGVLADVYHGTLALLHSDSKVDASDLSGLVQGLDELQKTDGSFGPESDDDGTLEGAAYALQTIKNVAGLMKFGETEQETINHIAEKADNLVDRYCLGALNSFSSNYF